MKSHMNAAAKAALKEVPEGRPLTVENILTLVVADLAAMSGPALATAYNLLSPEKPVARFATSEDGRKRLALKIEARKLAEKLAAGETAEVAKAKVTKKGEEQVAAIVASGEEMDKRLAKLNGIKTPVAASKAKPAGKPTIAGRCRELLAKGGRNEDIWAIIQPEFKLPDSKSTYPAYYRRKEAAKGKVYKAI